MAQLDGRCIHRLYQAIRHVQGMCRLVLVTWLPTMDLWLHCRDRMHSGARI